jgi:uncharacterized protein YndB with AHSA1/START domain
MATCWPGTVPQVARVRVEVVLDAPPEAVWADLEDLAGHVEWMADAVAIRFLTDQRTGVGTTFECDTKVGPLRLTDVMAITEWDPARSMGVRHTGVVTGTGRFTLAEAPGHRTRFRWEEELRFPLWLGGRLGAFMASPVLRWVWSRNLTRLAERFG